MVGLQVYLTLLQHSRIPKGYGTEQSDNCKNTEYSCALLAATAVCTSGFDHHGDGGAGSDRACRAMETLGGIIILFSKPNERKGVAPQLTAVLV